MFAGFSDNSQLIDQLNFATKMIHEICTFLYPLSILDFTSKYQQ